MHLVPLVMYAAAAAAYVVHFAWRDPHLRARLESFRLARETRAERILERINAKLAGEGRDLEACLEEALEAWLRNRQDAPERKRGHPVVDRGDQKL